MVHDFDLWSMSGGVGGLATALSQILLRQRASQDGTTACVSGACALEQGRVWVGEQVVGERQNGTIQKRESNTGRGGQHRGLRVGRGGGKARWGERWEGVMVGGRERGGMRMDRDTGPVAIVAIVAIGESPGKRAVWGGEDME